MRSLGIDEIETGNSSMWLLAKFRISKLVRFAMPGGITKMNKSDLIRAMCCLTGSATAENSSLGKRLSNKPFRLTWCVLTSYLLVLFPRYQRPYAAPQGEKEKQSAIFVSQKRANSWRYLFLISTTNNTYLVNTHHIFRINLSDFIHRDEFNKLYYCCCAAHLLV